MDTHPPHTTQDDRHLNLTIDIVEIAAVLNITRNHAYRYLRDGHIPSVRAGRRWIISRKRFYDWVNGSDGKD